MAKDDFMLSLEHQLKTFYPLVIAILVHFLALVTQEFNGSSLVHGELTMWLWDGSDFLLICSEFLQRAIAAYVFFVVWHVLKNERVSRRILAALVTTVVYLLLFGVVKVLYIQAKLALSLPSMPAFEIPIAIGAGVCVLALLAFTYRRQVMSVTA